MPPQPSNPWITDPEYIDFLNYIIEQTRNVEAPMNIQLLAREFKEKRGAAQTGKIVNSRIYKLRTKIHTFDHIDMNTKVKLMFALSASVNANLLKKLKEDAFVEIDHKKRITHYRANDESFELIGDHSSSAKMKIAMSESKLSLRKLISDYFENKKYADAVPENEEEKEMWNLIERITVKCENVDTPLSIQQLTKDFKKHFGITEHPETIRRRIKSYCREIQKAEFLDTQTSVKQLFSLSATVNLDYLEKLRKDAHVEVDKKNRISYYKANNGDFEMRGDHSQSAKTRIAWLEVKPSHQKLIRDYFDEKNNAEAVPKDKEKREMWNLIKFITEKCENVNSPLNINRLAKDFNKKFGTSIPLLTSRQRVKSYCCEIQRVEFLNTHAKVRQLFCLSATLNSDLLQELRKNAVVEVDNLNRIMKYTANDGSLTLHGDHSCSTKMKLGWIERRKRKKKVKKDCNSDSDEDEESEKENGSTEDDSDEYSSEEFDSEFDLDNDNNQLDETEDLTEPSNKVDNFDNETPVRNRSPTEISVADNLDFDPPTERSHRSEETEISEDQGNDPEIMGNTSVKTRYGRLSKRKHLDSDFSNNQVVNSSSLGAAMNTDPASSKPAKQKKIAIEKEQTSNSSSRSRRLSISVERSSRDSSFSTFSTELEEKMENQDAPRAEENPPVYHGPRIQEIDDYYYNPREDNLSESSPIDNRFKEPEPSAAKDHNPSIEAQNTHNRADAVAPKLHPEKKNLSLQNNTNSTPPTNEKQVISQEVPIKVENEEPITVEDHPKDVKPVTVHNSKIKFFEAMQSLILFLDTPSLSNFQSKIHQKIRKVKGSKGVLQNNEMIPALELLIARMANHSVIDISKRVKSVNLIQFLCYLKASILNSKMIGVDGLMNNISGLIEKSQNKRIPMEKVVNALRATLDIDKF